MGGGTSINVFSFYTSLAGLLGGPSFLAYKVWSHCVLAQHTGRVESTHYYHNLDIFFLSDKVPFLEKWHIKIYLPFPCAIWSQISTQAVQRDGRWSIVDYGHLQ